MDVCYCCHLGMSKPQKHVDGIFCGVGRYTVDLCHPDCFRPSKSWSFPTLQLDQFCAFWQTPKLVSLDSFWGMAPCCHPPHTTQCFAELVRWFAGVCFLGCQRANVVDPAEWLLCGPLGSFLVHIVLRDDLF